MLSDVMERAGDKLEYEYDFGDSWHHVLKLEKILPADPDEEYPICVTGRRACPPEDVGGIWGYTDFLEAIADKANPDHGTWVEWVGEDFDPAAFDPDLITEALLDMMDALVLAGPTSIPSPLSAWICSPPARSTSCSEPFPRRYCPSGLTMTNWPTAFEPPDPQQTCWISFRWVTHCWLRSGCSISLPSARTAPLIAEKLVEPGIAVFRDRAWIQERLAGAFQRLGPPAVPALLEVFDRLDDYGKALACVVLGQFDAPEGSDRIWTYFQSGLMK